MNFSCAIAGAFLLASVSGPAFAGGVPAAAMNKTITVSFAATGNAKSSDGQVKGFSTQVSRMPSSNLCAGVQPSSFLILAASMA